MESKKWMKMLLKVLPRFIPVVYKEAPGDNH